MLQYQTYLLKELTNRKKKNPQFSLRAFANFLDMSPSFLSSILKGKKKPSPNMLNEIFKKLNTNSLISKNIINELVNESSNQYNLELLTDETLEVINNWTHFAILSLAHIRNNESNVSWIAKKLDVGIEQVEASYLRLKRLNLIAEANGRFRQTTKPLHTNATIPSDTIKKCHKNNLTLAIEKLYTVPMESREFCSTTVDVDLKKLPEAKKMINQFKLDLTNFLKSEDSSEVFTLSMQLYPLTRIEKTNA